MINILIISSLASLFLPSNWVTETYKVSGQENLVNIGNIKHVYHLHGELIFLNKKSNQIGFLDLQKKHLTKVITKQSLPLEDLYNDYIKSSSHNTDEFSESISGIASSMIGICSIYPRTANELSIIFSMGVSQLDTVVENDTVNVYRRFNYIYGLGSIHDQDSNKIQFESLLRVDSLPPGTYPSFNSSIWIEENKVLIPLSIRNANGHINGKVPGLAVYQKTNNAYSLDTVYFCESSSMVNYQNTLYYSVLWPSSTGFRWNNMICLNLKEGFNENPPIQEIPFGTSEYSILGNPYSADPNHAYQIRHLGTGQKMSLSFQKSGFPIGVNDHVYYFTKDENANLVLNEVALN